MTFGFLAGLFGCRQPVDHGSWTSLVVSNLSPDRLDSYSFRVNVSENGEMMLFGYCYDDAYEYRSDEGTVLSAKAAETLRNLKIEKLATYQIKRKSWPFKAVDTVERIAQVTYEDASEFAIFLSNEQRAAIVTCLRGELIGAASAKLHGEWMQLHFNQSGGDNFSNYFGISLEQNANGQWIASGYCPDSDGTQISCEDGFAVSEDALTAIRMMKLESYAPEVHPDTSEEDDILLLDGESITLTLVFADGHLQNKALPSEIRQQLFSVLQKEFEKHL